MIFIFFSKYLTNIHMSNLCPEVLVAEADSALTRNLDRPLTVQLSHLHPKDA